MSVRLLDIALGAGGTHYFIQNVPLTQISWYSSVDVNVARLREGV